MSDDKQPKTKRAAPLPRTVDEPVAQVVEPAISAPEPAAPAPEPIVVAPAAPKTALPVRVSEPSRGGERWSDAYRAILVSMSESQVAIASDTAALSLEMSGLTRSYLTAAGDSAVAFFTARSLAEAVEAQLGFARRSLDTLAGSSTRLGELGLRLAEAATKPVFRSFAAG